MPKYMGLLVLMVLVLEGCSSRPSTNDYQMLQAVMQKSAQADQQAISGLRTELQAVQKEVEKLRAARTAAEARATDAERRLDAQREELARAKDDKIQASSLGRQLSEELARAKEDRTQLSQAVRQLMQQVGELDRLKQSVAEVARDQSRLHAMEEALERQTKELQALHASIRGAVPSSRVKAKTAKPSPLPPAKPTDIISLDGKPAPSKSRTVVIKQGDTLGSLAKQHNVAVTILKDVNHLSTEQLVPGQTLVIPDMVSGEPKKARPVQGPAQ